MNVECPSCGNQKSFRVPLWVKCTFRVEADGMVNMLHLNQLESLEEKLTDSQIQCRTCGARARVVFDGLHTTQEEKRQRRTLEGL